MSHKFNESQISAINTFHGPLLILAGAGTGKTSTITARIANLVQSGVADSSQILALTFTNKAAKEMKQRVESQVANTSPMWLGTFHGIGARLLRAHAKAIDLDTNFIIIDAKDREKLLKQIITELNIDEKRFSVNTLGFIISNLKELCIRSNQADRLSEFKHKDLDIAKIYEIYQIKLKGLNAVDFDDLISECVYLFERNPNILSDVQDRFQYITVDEYQDTNSVQNKFLRILASKYQNICCVGDEDQSIYSWRGAKVTNILRFGDHFPGAKIIKLEDNYRSTDKVLNAAVSLISHNKDRYGKVLRSSNIGSELPKIVLLEDDRREVSSLINQIQSLNVDYSNVAILVRAAYQMRAIEEGLIGNNIPYTIVDGVRFYDRKEIKDLTSYLRYVYSQKDVLALERIINTPKRGIGDKSWTADIMPAISSIGNSIEALKHVVNMGLLSGKASAGLSEFIGNIEKWKSLLTSEKHNLSSLMEMIYRESGYLEMLQEELKTDPDISSRIENIREFIASLNEFDSIEQFLEHLSLLSMTDKEESHGVKVMTMHASKGLEFDYVFLPGWDEEIFPSRKSVEESAEGLEEERRLAYVAITRARKNFFIYSSARRMMFGKIQGFLPSRFIKEIGDAARVQDLSKQMQRSFGDVKFANSVPSFQKSKTIGSSSNSLSTGAKVFHDKFGNGTISRSIGKFWEVKFDNGMTHVVQGDFLKKR